MIKTVAFTGHRPQAFKDEAAITWVQEQLNEAVKRAISAGVNWFISGGALGVDQWAISSVLSQPLGDCRLTIARPFPSQAAVWTPQQQEAYQNMLAAADEVYDVNPDPYASWKYIVRDKWMVDTADAVIAVWDGRPKGGTYHTYCHAVATKKRVYRIDPIEQTSYWVKE